MKVNIDIFIKGLHFSKMSTRIDSQEVRIGPSYWVLIIVTGSWLYVSVKDVAAMTI